jgi:hypothetical protein
MSINIYAVYFAFNFRRVFPNSVQWRRKDAELASASAINFLIEGKVESWATGSSNIVQCSSVELVCFGEELWRYPRENCWGLKQNNFIVQKGNLNYKVTVLLLSGTLKLS